jgi:hypothetical protein
MTLVGRPAWAAGGRAAASVPALVWPRAAVAGWVPVPLGAAAAGQLQPVAPAAAVGKPQPVAQGAMAQGAQGAMAPGAMAPAVRPTGAPGATARVAAVRLPGEWVGSGVDLSPLVALSASVEWMGWSAARDWAASGQPSGRFRTASSRVKAAAAAPGCLHAGSSRAAGDRSRRGSAAKSGLRDESAAAGGGAAGPQARRSAAVLSAA